MNNENKEFFISDVENNISEEAIVLAPPTELFDEAKEIERGTKSNEKYPFILQYDANQKDFLKSMLQMVGAIVENDDEEDRQLFTQMNMTQLAFIKRLDCVERVKTDEGRNPFIRDEAVSSETIHETPIEAPEAQTAEVTQNAQVMMLSADEQIVSPVASDEAIAANVECVDGTESSCCCPTNTKMESAEDIQVEHFVSGCICCPCSEQWFKFTVSQTKAYTIYTSGSLDTIGTLYDCCGNYITQVDDAGGKLNFRISRTLTAGATYYIKVRAYSYGTGSYTLRVTDLVFANYVTINKSTINLVKGVTYELPITPNYTYKGYNGAQRIDGLSVSISPSNADEQKIWWYEFDGNVIDCKYGWDDDGDRYIHVTAKNNGTTKLYAVDWNENGRRDVVIVDSREIVTVKRDGNFNKIEFANGNVWRCINFDMINNDTNKNNPTLEERLWENTYNTIEHIGTMIYADNPKTYSNNEYKLLYLIDPYGFSAYIQEYGKHVYGGNLASLVVFKDSVFETLYNRSPKYFARDNTGEWYDATSQKEQLSIHQMLSESELIFGVHTVYDFKLAVQFFDVVLKLLTLPVAFAGLAGISVPTGYTEFLKYANLTYTLSKSLVEEDYKTYLETLINEANGDSDSGEDTKSANYNMDWAKALFELSDSFGELADIVAERPTFYKEIFDRCAADSNYRIFFEYNNGTIEEM